jgi:hypothetical protein
MPPLRFLILLIAFACSTVVCQAQLTYNELRINYDSPWTYKNLQLIPIRFKPIEAAAPATASVSSRPITFSEALHKRKIKLTEMQFENGADVNWLQVTNNSKQSVMVQSGEVLDGGKQDRMVGETKFIAPGTTDYINVFCIEKRRWSDKAKEFRHRGVANSEVRKAMDKRGRQADVWKEIDRQFESKKKSSETFSYFELGDMVMADTGYINYFTRKYIDSGSHITGFIFITGDRIMSTEIFASPALLELSFANILSSYVQSVFNKGAPPVVSVPTQKSFMDKVLANEEAQKAYVTTHGKIHRNEGKVVHIIAYPD